jgi:hypothetical protein
MIRINGKPALEQEKIANVAFHELPGGECRLLISDQSLTRGSCLRHVSVLKRDAR